VQHEVVAEAGHRDRVELERAEPADDREHCIRAALERARRREELPGDEKAARVLFGDLHLGDATAGPAPPQAYGRPAPRGQALRATTMQPPRRGTNANRRTAENGSPGPCQRLCQQRLGNRGACSPIPGWV